MAKRGRKSKVVTKPVNWREIKYRDCGDHIRYWNESAESVGQWDVCNDRAKWLAFAEIATSLCMTITRLELDED